MSPMHPLLKLLIAATVLAIAVVVIQSQRNVAEQEAWGQLAVARDQGLTVEALETARDQARGTSAEPWIDYQLALKLYDAGGSENFERARQVAQEAIERHPEHAISEVLHDLVEALETFSQPAVGG